MICKSVLVIDRDHDERVLLRKKLEEAGHFVVSCTSCGEAMGLLEKISKPSMILLNDESMDFTGEQLLNLLKQNDKFNDIPVSQIQSPKTKQLQGTAYYIKATNVEPILHWLKYGSSTFSVQN